MKRADLKHLHYITPIENIPSILKHGILCHNLARKLKPASIAMERVQERRKNRAIPNGGNLHDYANLYINARNPMMYLRRGCHRQICVLAIDKGVLDEQGVVVSDMNAAREIALFSPPDEGLEKLKVEEVFAERWTHSDPIVQSRHKGIMCAEVLVPNCIHPKFILGAYVSCEESQTGLKSSCPSLKIKLEPHLFFA